MLRCLTIMEMKLIEEKSGFMRIVGCLLVVKAIVENIKERLSNYRCLGDWWPRQRNVRWTTRILFFWIVTSWRKRVETLGGRRGTCGVDLSGFVTTTTATITTTTTIGAGSGVLGVRPCWCSPSFPLIFSYLGVFPFTILHLRLKLFNSCFLFITDVSAPIWPTLHLLTF